MRWAKQGVRNAFHNRTLRQGSRITFNSDGHDVARMDVSGMTIAPKTMAFSDHPFSRHVGTVSSKKKSELCDRGNCLVARASDVASGLICCDLAVQVVMKTAWFGSNRRFAMSALKPLALGILVWAASGTVIRADPITWPNNFNWVAYFAGQNGDGGAFPAPASTSAAAPIAPPVSQPPFAQLVATPTMMPPAPMMQAAATVPPAASAAVTVVANAPVMQPNLTPAVSPVPASSGPVDAFINLGNGPYALQNAITTGNAQPWYNSSQITSLFGGQPSSQQVQSFDNAIMAHVQQTFSQSGISVTLTDNPNVAALHTISVVSNTASASLSSAIGMTEVGASGFSFIDKSAPSAQSVDQLEWIVAHNISHELMLAFGVPENYDQTGNYIDAKVANWAMMVSPTATFSPAAAQAIVQALAAQNTAESTASLGAQLINSSESTVPEPATIALWALAGAALVLSGRRRSRAGNAAAATPLI
jgi:hypothetical protein